VRTNSSAEPSERTKGSDPIACRLPPSLPSFFRSCAKPSGHDAQILRQDADTFPVSWRSKFQFPLNQDS